MKHLVPTLVGLVVMVVLSTVYYELILGGIPTGACMKAEPNMAVGMLANVLYVALIAYIISATQTTSAKEGAKHGAIVALTANGFLNLLMLAMFDFPMITTATVIQDIVVNIPIGAAVGASIAWMAGRGQ
jgi:hypothetical protein